MNILSLFQNPNKTLCPRRIFGEILVLIYIALLIFQPAHPHLTEIGAMGAALIGSTAVDAAVSGGGKEPTPGATADKTK
jgi:hypothetical protein